MIANNKKLSIFIDRFIPSHIKDSDPQFALFIQKYLVFLESTDKPHDIIRRLIEYVDIDTSIDRFFDLYHTQYIPDLPRSYRTDIKLFMRNVHDYVTSKGTENSFKYLFRAIFNEEISFYYPKVDILRCSDGKWYEPEYIIVTGHGTAQFATQNELVKWTNKDIVGQTSGSQGYVDGIVKTGDPLNTNQNIWVIRVVDPTGTFVLGEVLQDSENLLPSINVGDGVGYTAIQKQPGSWKNTDGFLNSNKYIQDNNFYQDHSYQIKSPRGISDYWHMLKKNIHPSGKKFFGAVQVVSANPTDGIAPSIGTDLSKIRWFPYTAGGKTISIITKATAASNIKSNTHSLGLGVSYAEFQAQRESFPASNLYDVGFVDGIPTINFDLMPNLEFPYIIPGTIRAIPLASYNVRTSLSNSYAWFETNRENKFNAARYSISTIRNLPISDFVTNSANVFPYTTNAQVFIQ